MVVNPDSLTRAFARRLREAALIIPRLTVASPRLSTTLRIYVDETGTARCAEVIASSGFEDFDSVVVGVALESRYTPGELATKPRNAWLVTPFTAVVGLPHATSGPRVTAFLTRRTHRPLILTQHGKSAAVLLGAAEYEALVDELELLRDVAVAERQSTAVREPLTRKQSSGLEIG
jgi:prevent-host-death family protein